MAKKVFISFKYGEQPWHNDVLQFFQKWGGKAQATPVYLEESITLGSTETQIRAAITAKMKDCRGLLVVIGNKAQASPWIDYEVQVASSAGRPCAGTRHPQASGAPPVSFPNLKMLPWDSQDIASWIESL
jgi:hypothetical protein